MTDAHRGADDGEAAAAGGAVGTHRRGSGVAPAIPPAAARRGTAASIPTVRIVPGWKFWGIFLVGKIG